MNKDHTADMSAILRHYAGLTEAQAADPEMLDLDLATMTLRAGGDNHKIHAVPVTPPMTTWADRRARLVDMTLAAKQALGLPTTSSADQDHQQQQAAPPPPPPIKWYAPEGADLVPFTVVFLDYLSSLLVVTGQIAPGTPLWHLLDKIPLLPGGPAGFAWAVTRAFPLFVLAHVAEMFWFDRTRLAPAGVRRGSWVWCQWLAGQFFDGFATFQRWDRRILGKARAGDAKLKGEKDL